MMRVSLYKHELEIVAQLTVNLTRVCRDEELNLKAEIIGPEIFGKLIDCLYARGNYQHASYMKFEPMHEPSNEAVDFQEVGS